MISWEEHVACMGKMRNAYKIVEGHKRRDHLLTFSHHSAITERILLQFDIDHFCFAVSDPVQLSSCFLSTKSSSTGCV
jgi:hypothetical protein